MSRLAALPGSDPALLLKQDQWRGAVARRSWCLGTGSDQKPRTIPTLLIIEARFGARWLVLCCIGAQRARSACTSWLRETLVLSEAGYEAHSRSNRWRTQHATLHITLSTLHWSTLHCLKPAWHLALVSFKCHWQPVPFHSATRTAALRQLDTPALVAAHRLKQAPPSSNGELVLLPRGLWATLWAGMWLCPLLPTQGWQTAGAEKAFLLLARLLTSTCMLCRDCSTESLAKRNQPLPLIYTESTAADSPTSSPSFPSIPSSPTTRVFYDGMAVTL